MTQNSFHDRLTLISHPLCPYVQRAAIALAEKQVPFQRIDINLGNKPDWFLAISPLGKTPVLQVGQGRRSTAIFESTVILEYLEETTPVPLYPADPLHRAVERGWIEIGTSMLNAIAALYGAADRATFDRATDAIGQLAARLEERLQSRQIGPWFGGGTFGIVDAAFAPVFRYFDSFETEAGLRLLDGHPAIAAWRSDLGQRTSVRQAVAADYPHRLKRFLLGRGSVLGAMITAHGGAQRPAVA